MTKARFQRCSLLLAVACLAPAAETIGGPIAGYAAEPSGARIRAILGVPGAFAYSAPLALPQGITRVRLPPGQDFALVERGSAAPAMLFLKDGAVDHLVPISGAMPSADWVAFSPSAASAILFSAAGRLQVISGFPDTPQLVLDLDSASLPEVAHVGAVSDDGTLVLVGSNRSLYRLTRDNGAQIVLAASSILSVTILRNGKDAAVSDSGTGSVYLVSNIGDNPASRVLASGLDGIGDVFPSWDGKSLFMACPGAQSVSWIELEAGTVRSFRAGAPPVQLTPLRNHDTFLISAVARQPGWVFYRDGVDAAVVFIPASRMQMGADEPRRGSR